MSAWAWFSVQDLRIPRAIGQAVLLLPFLPLGEAVGPQQRPEPAPSPQQEVVLQAG